MPFCPECGKNVGTSQKFCRSCGASLIEESPAAAAPPVPSSGGLTCRTCGAALAPDEKFCGSCGTKGRGCTGPRPCRPAPAPIYQQPRPQVYQAPASGPRPRPPSAAVCRPACHGSSTAPTGLVCKACGNPNKTGDKYCSKCLVKVPSSPAAAPAAYQPPAAEYQTPAPVIPSPAPVYQQPPPPPVYRPRPPLRRSMPPRLHRQRYPPQPVLAPWVYRRNRLRLRPRNH